MLAVGIGANTAIFSVVDAVLLRPLPYREAGRMVVVWEKRVKEGTTDNSISPADYIDWRAQNHVFSALDANDEASLNLTGTATPRRVTGLFATADMMAVYGIQPFLGRGFVSADERGDNRIALVSHALWQQTLGSDPDAVGREISLNDKPYKIVGVLPAGFRIYIGREVDVVAPLRLGAEERQDRAGHRLLVVGRLRPGVSLDQARTEMATISQRLERQYPVEDTGHSANVVPLGTELTKGVRSGLYILLTAVFFVLLIACANIANLLLARTCLREREIAIRRALGASAMQLFRLLLAESLCLAGAGAAVGILIAYWGLKLIQFVPHTVGGTVIPGLDHVALDWRILVFAIAVSAATALFFGIAPSFQAVRPVSRTHTASSSARLFQRALVVSEIAIACVLLIGSALLISSFARMLAVNPGFQATHRLSLEMRPSPVRYHDLKSQNALYAEVVSRVSALPSVESAALTTLVPGNTWGPRWGLVIEGRPRPQTMEEWPKISWRIVTSGFLDTMSIPVVRGRGFSAGDSIEAPKVALISRTAARQFWGDADPLGKRIAFAHDPAWRTIVDIAGDVKYLGLDRDTAPEIYLPATQYALDFPEMGLVVRTAGDAGALAPVVGRTIAAIDPNLPVGDVMTVEDLIGLATAPRRFNAVLVGAFGGIALLLALAGLYSVIAYLVAQRTREFGIRLAVGAQRGNILRLVAGEGGRLAVIGTGVGCLIAWAVSGALKSMLFGLSATDPVVYGLSAVVLLTVAVAACVVPAVRAARVDPIEALREE